LGEGAFAKVYLATLKGSKSPIASFSAKFISFRSLPQQVAIKVCDKGQCSPEDLLGLEQEISILKTLVHGHIVRLYDTYMDPMNFYLVLEYMAGGDLIGRIVSLKKYTEQDAKHACKQILKALEHCHAQKIAHRDIKMENILLATTELEERDELTISNIKLADFGFAARYPSIRNGSDEIGFKTQCGTPLYVAPEIIKGKKYNVAVDMWSLGVLMFILLCGYPPFHDKDTQNIFKLIVSGQVKFQEKYWGAISPEAKQFIKALLTVDPSKRLTAKDAKNHPWLLSSQDPILPTMSLTDIFVQERLRILHTKAKLRAAVYTVIATNKFTSLGFQFRTAVSGLC
jgi:calcium/calmodulin-dependent protein kinase I